MTLPRWRAPLAVSLGAIPGALSRYYLGGALVHLTGVTDFPLGTLVVNLLGCFGLGFFVTITLSQFTLSPAIRLAVVTGFLGAFTTFSSYELEVANLAETRQWWIAGFYWLGSLLLGLLCLRAGMALAQHLGRAQIP